MKPAAFDFDPVIDMGSPAIGQAPSGVRWEKQTDAPANGSTPAARHASATGAAAAHAKVNTRIKRLLLFFLDSPRLTLDQARTLMELPVNCVTGPWNRLEHKLGWIRGTGEFEVIKSAAGRPIRREWHELTVSGRAIALELRRQKGGR
jgi:hypothetical protein